MQIWAESGKSALPICNYSQILYQFLTFTQNLKRSPSKQCHDIYDLIEELFSGISSSSELVEHLAILDEKYPACIAGCK